MSYSPTSPRTDMLRQQFGCPGRKPCAWPEWDDACCDACSGMDEDAIKEMWEGVTEWLYEATCRQFSGRCTHRMTACPPCGCSHVFCRCGPYKEISIGDHLCQSISEDEDGWPSVTIGIKTPTGTTLFPASDGAFHFNAARGVIVVPDGSPIWDLPNQDYWDDSALSWWIDVTTGDDPPKLMVRAAQALACEFIKACKGEDSCLPDNVRSITRRGLEMGVEAFAETIRFDEDDYGIPELNFVMQRWGCDTMSAGGFISPVWEDEGRDGWMWRQVGPTVRG